MKTVDCTFQNLDSSEISLTDVSHYYDSDPTKIVQGLRKDGKRPSAYIADTTTANAQVCTEGDSRGVGGDALLHVMVRSLAVVITTLRWVLHRN